MNNLISLNSVLEQAIVLGASATYKNFKEAVFKDKALKASMVTIAQGPQRSIYLVDAEAGRNFAEQYAKDFPKKVSAPEVPPTQMALPLEEPIINERIAALEAQFNRVVTNMERLLAELASGQIAIINKVDKLTAIWEATEVEL